MQPPTQPPAPNPDTPPEPEPTSPGRRTHPAAAAIDAAVAHASGLLRKPVESIDVLTVHHVTWPDSCLGIPQDGEACADVLTPGYLVELEDGFRYRADRQGNVRRELGRHQTGPVEPDPPVPDPDVLHLPDDLVPKPGQIRLTYVKEGGIGGWRSTFETTSADLSAAELAELQGLITASRFYDVAAGPTESPAPDGIVRRLWIAVDRRGHTVVRGDGIEIEDDPAFHALVAWVEQRTPPFVPSTEL